MLDGGASTAPAPRGAHRGRALALAVVAVLTLVALAGGGVMRASDDSLDRPREARMIRIGYAVEAPYAFVDAQGTISGESPEIGRRIARDLGIERVDWIQTQFDRLIPELESGRFDVIASGLFVTPERAQRVAFSRPTFRVGTGILVLAKQAEPPTSCRALAGHAAVRIAVLRGAVEGDWLRACGVAPGRILEVPDAAAGRSAVLTEVVFGLALSAPTLRWMSAQERPPRTKVVALDLEGAAAGRGAFAFRREDRALRLAWDEALARFLGTPEHLAMVTALAFDPEEVEASSPGGARP